MAKRQKITPKEFKIIKDHWDIWTKAGCDFFYPKDMGTLEEILKHCNSCHHIPEILLSQKDKLLERLNERDIRIKAKRQ